MFFGGNVEFVVEGVMLDFFYVVLVGDDIVFDRVVKCEDIMFGLGFIINVWVFLIYINYNIMVMGVIDNGSWGGELVEMFKKVVIVGIVGSLFVWCGWLEVWFMENGMRSIIIGEIGFVYVGVRCMLVFIYFLFCVVFLCLWGWWVCCWVSGFDDVLSCVVVLFL